MSTPSNAARYAAPSKRAASPARTLSASAVADLSRHTQSGTRRYDIAALRPDGSQHIGQISVPVHPLFDDAFAAFARGTLLQTPEGEIAIEDLRPGDALWTSTGVPARVMWIGSGSFAPVQISGDRPERAATLVRIMPDSFGQTRPANFVTLGPSARILQTPPALRGQVGDAGILTPVQAFVDSVNVIEITPPTPVTLFHIVLERHAAIRAGGLECETYHPGAQAPREVSASLRDLFVSMFPHMSHVSDFGPLAHPRAQADDARLG